MLFFNLFIYINPKITYAISCNEINMNNKPVEYSYTALDNKDINNIINDKNKFISQISKITDLTPKDKKYTAEISIQRPAGLSNGGNTFVVSIINATEAIKYYAYIEYIATASLYFDNKYIEKIDLGQSNLVVKHAFDKDDKNHTLKAVISYQPTGRYCETSTSAFVGIDGKTKASPKFTTESQPYTLSLTDNECKKLSQDVSNQICAYMDCLKDLYKNDSYWTKKPSPNFTETLSIMVGAGWDATALTNSGKTKLSQCKNEQQKFINLKEQYQSKQCKDPILWQGKCHFSDNANDTELKPDGNSETADNLNWFVNKTNIVASNIEDMPTSIAKSPCNAQLCNNMQKQGFFSDIINKNICNALCMITDAFGNMIIWSFNVLRSAISTESKKFEKVPTISENASTGSNTNTSGGSGGSDNTPTVYDDDIPYPGEENSSDDSNSEEIIIENK